MADATAQQPKPGRDIKGRFVQGNTASRGNPSGLRGRPKTYAADYLDAMKEELTPAKWQGIIRKAIEQALDGDHRARTFLAAYVMGQPVQQVIADVTGSRDKLLQVLGDIERSLLEVEDSGAQSDLAPAHCEGNLLGRSNSAPKHLRVSVSGTDSRHPPTRGHILSSTPWRGGAI